MSRRRMLNGDSKKSDSLLSDEYDEKDDIDKYEKNIEYEKELLSPLNKLNKNKYNSNKRTLISGEGFTEHLDVEKYEEPSIEEFLHNSKTQPNLKKMNVISNDTWNLFLKRLTDQNPGEKEVYIIEQEPELEEEEQENNVKYTTDVKQPAEYLRKLAAARLSVQKCMKLTQQVSETPAEIADEDMESSPSLQTCSRCTCKMNCLCSCHFLHEKSKMERETDRKDDRSYCDLKPELDYKKDDLKNDFQDLHHENPSFDPRTEHGRDFCVDEQESNDESQEVYGACEDDRGSPPNDGSSNNDNSYDGHNKQDCISAQKEENKENAWVIDTEVWKKCIDMKGVQEANRLLNKRILPDQEMLDRGSEVFGISSNTIHNMCTAICCYIKETFIHTVHVWPALDYRHGINNRSIIFVINRTHPCKNETIQYKYFIRHVNEISPSAENSRIRELEQGFEKDDFKLEEIAECLNKNSKSLMEQHTNLTRASISWFKSKGFGTHHQEIIEKTCIALYVHIKGFVPLNEAPLPKVIDGIDVDVRECVVHPYTFHNEHHENIKMGCAIHGGVRNPQGKLLGGTLGGFFEIDGQMYCITSAHIVMSAANMSKLKQCGKYCDLGNDIETFEAHQPVVDGSRSFRTGVRAVYKEGGNGETGVEAVVIKVQERFPKTGEFPECPNRNNPGIDRPKFSTGKMCNREEVNRLIRNKTLTVVKFGCSSGWTRGSFRFSAGVARLSNMVGSIHDFGILLLNQFEIENIGETKFAEYGDSGALVFTDKNNELSVIGILEGGTPDIIYVTPICDVFSALELQNVQSTKGFTLRYQGIQNIPMDITPDAYTPPAITNRSDSGILTNEEAVLKHIEEKLQSFDQAITHEVARQVHELEENINTTVNQELSPVKSELNKLKTDVSFLKSNITNIKSEVQQTKSELKQDIDKFNTEVQSKMNIMQEQFTEQTNSIMNKLSECFRPNVSSNASNSDT